MKTQILTILLSVFLSTAMLAQAPANIPEKPEMISVAGGSFNMGSNSGYLDEKPVHRVSLSAYKISKFPITVGQYKAFVAATGRSMPDAPSWGWKDKHPMVKVIYNDAVAYCNWLGEKYGGDWRLPTEAQWEYAARGGQKSQGYTYAGGSVLYGLGWYADNAGGQTQAVGRRKPNELGIYDMSGNVWEWCMDWYDSDYYANSPSSNPRGPSSGPLRVLRGGCWYGSAFFCRVASRGDGDPSYRYSFGGFRVVLSQ